MSYCALCAKAYVLCCAECGLYSTALADNDGSKMMTKNKPGRERYTTDNCRSVDSREISFFTLSVHFSCVMESIEGLKTS